MSSITPSGAASSISDLGDRLDALRLGSEKATTSPSRNILSNVHTDDIHGLIQIASDRLVSGSKDTTCKIYLSDNWSTKRPLTKTLASGSRGYTNWVTALAKINESGLWVSARRNGEIEVWDKEGVEVTRAHYTPPSRGISKERNLSRINCVSAFPFSASAEAIQFYTGTPLFIQLWSLSLSAKPSLRLDWQARSSANDWIYTIHPLDSFNLSVVIGTKLYKWNVEDRSKVKSESLFAPAPAEERLRQRPFISSICPLTSDVNRLTMAFFGGKVALLDMTTKTVIATHNEHIGRVWSVQNIREHCFASGADDSLIKIWDERVSHSVGTISGNPGRVSCLLQLQENSLVSASCPDDVYSSEEKASLSFWDLRRLDSKTK